MKKNKEFSLKIPKKIHDAEAQAEEDDRQNQFWKTRQQRQKEEWKGNISELFVYDFEVVPPPKKTKKNNNLLGFLTKKNHDKTG